jgi:serine/threonine protein kinase
MSQLKINTVLNRNQYKIVKFIGQGGFGITYLADEIGYYRTTGFGEEFIKHKTPEKVVVKELFYKDFCSRDDKTGLVSISDSSKKIEFQKLVKNQLEEGSIIKKLDHPNIIKTRDIFEENDTAYMVMDYIESTDLEEQLKIGGKIPKVDALRYIVQILDAVDYFHNHASKKILHLDISPSNILVEQKNNDAILIDFGSALSYDNIDQKIKATTSQIITGRKKYYSPNEQGDIDNLKTFDATFDTYAIGATLYHILTGHLPPLSALLSSGREQFVPPSQRTIENEISDFLDAIIAKAMAPMYINRYSAAATLKDDLLKEKKYIDLIEKLNLLIDKNQFDEAEQCLEQNKNNYLETNTLLKFEAELKEKKKTIPPTSEYVDIIETEKLEDKTHEKSETEKPAQYIKPKTDNTITIPIESRKPTTTPPIINVPTNKPSFFEKYKKTILIAIASLIVFPILILAVLFTIGTYATPDEETNATPIVYQENELYGYKINDSIAIPAQFISAGPFENKQAKVSRNDSIFYIDTQGSLVLFVGLATAPATATQPTSQTINPSDALDEPTAAQKKAEAERLAKEKADKEKISKQEAERERLAEKERLAELERKRLEKEESDKIANKKNESDYYKAIADLKNKITSNNTRTINEAIKNMGSGTKNIYIEQLQEIGNKYPQGSEHKNLINQFKTIR